ncbi:hypothetical protein A2899_00445 [Candidatus Amesbacteria bacterium RIFCSPLOWO2_01_FULL_49_25]|uniref:Uncharacterized protein n=1 Tax=Candidatus Amesbacteria bacterium RIFCSPHIGHO2_01_FULL_48_32b TaxID=1797253 RepID=A0A1F4YD97_9BACT|nr:MAG: hypothetical protein A2876_03885 [Candidatus Amesbacteria bacterium RIFCSPHIGHO2_01_FULL_48_32b]OGD07593.1 MAG: hypothetical protein A2899_00445 [Candidatus Amesbacteria bacterium RIFCSPLOWO2_01_FULL_49_25]
MSEVVRFEQEVEIIGKVVAEPAGEGSGFSGLVLKGLRKLFLGFYAAEWEWGETIAETLNSIGQGKEVRLGGRIVSGRGVEVRVITDVDCDEQK